VNSFQPAQPKLKFQLDIKGHFSCPEQKPHVDFGLRIRPGSRPLSAGGVMSIPDLSQAPFAFIPHLNQGQAILNAFLLKGAGFRFVLF
jgi:hypothetical protein